MTTYIPFSVLLMASILFPHPSLGEQNNSTPTITIQVDQPDQQALPENFSSEAGTVNCTGEGEHAICIET